MDTAHGTASASWLALREPADAAARAPELVEELRRHLHGSRSVEVLDLGCGTGSMARWLAPRLHGPQSWVLVDRDPALLAVAADELAPRTCDGDPVTLQTRRQDITRLLPDEVGDPTLITGSALLDMLTQEDLARVVLSCNALRCPVLITLTVTGEVELVPHDPFDEQVGQAFNGHQRRVVARHGLLGPDAVAAAVGAFERLGRDVMVRPSPWRLGPGQRTLQTEWFTGWLDAACEQSDRVAARAPSYRERRLAEAASGDLHVTVHHEDLLVLPR